MTTSPEPRPDQPIGRVDRSLSSHLMRDRWAVTIAAVIWIVGTIFGTGVIGGESRSKATGYSATRRR